jgi:hypothetical protein
MQPVFYELPDDFSKAAVVFYGNSSDLRVCFVVE